MGDFGNVFVRCGLTNQLYEMTTCFSLLSIHNSKTDRKHPIRGVMEPLLCDRGDFGLCGCTRAVPFSDLWNFDVLDEFLRNKENFRLLAELDDDHLLDTHRFYKNLSFVGDYLRITDRLHYVNVLKERRRWFEEFKGMTLLKRNQVLQLRWIKEEVVEGAWKWANGQTSEVDDLMQTLFVNQTDLSLLESHVKNLVELSEEKVTPTDEVLTNAKKYMNPYKTKPPLLEWKGFPLLEDISQEFTNNTQQVEFQFTASMNNLTNSSKKQQLDIFKSFHSKVVNVGYTYGWWLPNQPQEIEFYNRILSSIHPRPQLTSKIDRYFNKLTRDGHKLTIIHMQLPKQSNDMYGTGCLRIDSQYYYNHTLWMQLFLQDLKIQPNTNVFLVGYGFQYIHDLESFFPIDQLMKMNIHLIPQTQLLGQVTVENQYEMSVVAFQLGLRADRFVETGCGSQFGYHLLHLRKWMGREVCVASRLTEPNNNTTINYPGTGKSSIMTHVFKC